MRDRIFYSICFGFVLGVLWGSFVSTDLYLVFLFAEIAFALFLFFSLISQNSWGIIASIFILTFVFGLWRFSIADRVAPIVVSMHGEIVDEPTMGGNKQKMIVQTKETIILITTDFENNYKYGDIINFSGKLEKPENFITDQGKEFDYINYLRKDGIFYVISFPKVEIISRGNGNFIQAFLFSVKEKFLEKMNLAIQTPESLLMGGLILGEKASFSAPMRKSFVDTGTIHIIALSGYNVTIVAEWLMKLFAQIPYASKNLGIGIGIFTILLFVLMTGGSSTAIRAGIMAVLALIARATGRNYDVARALILAGVFMILLNPFVLVYDVSFQLSFIATVAVIFFTPKIEKYFLWVTKSFGLRDIISVTCATYIFIMPFILYKMGNLSIVALPANILILPLIPFTMFLGFLTSFVGLISYVPSVPLGYISYLFLHYELGVINFFANIPFASLSFPNFPFLLTLAIYAYFIYVLFGKSVKKTFETNF